MATRATGLATFLTAALPDRQRYARSQGRGLSYEEIASEQDSSWTAVNRHLTRARWHPRAIQLDH